VYIDLKIEKNVRMKYITNGILIITLTDKEKNMSNKMTIIATKGTLDWAYPPYILASTGVAMGKDVTIFFTFYGLNLLLKDTSKLKVSPIGKVDMPMKLPFGPKFIQKIDWNKFIPNIVWQLPFIDVLSTYLMHKTTVKNGVASIEELRGMCQEFGVKFIACEMTVELFGYSKDDFIDGVEFAGAATYMEESSDSTNNLFI
jgi:peroxiredoxin family protein